VRSLETNWLSHFDKSLVRPEVIYMHSPEVRGEPVGGYYVQPADCEYFIDGQFYDARFGIIVAATKEGDEFCRSTVAHEWRHHWQLHNGIPFDHHEWKLVGSYDDCIRRYFRESQSELDALLFEHKVARCDGTEQMMDIVMKGCKKIIDHPARFPQ
jgi:hypothetical protein